MPVQQPGQLQLFRPRARIRLVSNLQEVRQHVVLRESACGRCGSIAKAAVFLSPTFPRCGFAVPIRQDSSVVLPRAVAAEQAQMLLLYSCNPRRAKRPALWRRSASRPPCRKHRLVLAFRLLFDRFFCLRLCILENRFEVSACLPHAQGMGSAPSSPQMRTGAGSP